MNETCNTESEKNLFKAVMRQIGDWESVFECPDDYRDAGSGVSGFIYYSDTVKFAKKHLVDIINVLNAFENELGEPLGTKPQDAGEETLFNWYAWFALEHCIDKVMTYKENANV